MAGLRQLLQAGGVGGVGLAAVAHVHEHAVGAIHRHLGQRLARYGQDALAFFPGAFGNELLQPQAEVGQFVGHHQRELVAALLGQGAQGGAQRQAGVVGHRAIGPAGAHHAHGARQQLADVQAVEGGRHQAEVGQGRKAPAHVGEIQEDAAVALRRGRGHELRAGVGDGHEVFAGPVALDFLKAGVEIVAESQRLGRGARLAGHHEQGFGQRHGGFNLAHGAGVGGVEHRQGQAVRAPLEGGLEHQRRHRAAAHAHHHHVPEAGGPHFGHEIFNLGHPAHHRLGHPQPAHEAADALLPGRVGHP